jgi:predicted metal-dependent hydrolase
MPAGSKNEVAIRKGASDTAARACRGYNALDESAVFHCAAGEEPAMSDDYHPLYLDGIKHFNECDFFEAHEVWEELWTDYRGESRKFYQGLIQAAVALFHFGNGNIRGARKLFHSSSDYLSAYGPWHLGLNVEKFLVEFKRCFAEVIATNEEFPKIEVDPELIPEIHLDLPASG